MANLKTAIPTLGKRRVISYGDLDHKNVLWDTAGKPGSIDSDAVEASFHCVMGDWLNWLMYNIGRNIYLEAGEPFARNALQ